VMELCPNGSIFHISQQYHGRIPINIIRYYAIEILRLIEYMHSRNTILYRALDMRKLLLDVNGHMKLTSFRRTIHHGTTGISESMMEMERKFYEEDVIVLLNKNNNKKSLTNKEKISRNCIPLINPDHIASTHARIDFWTLGCIIAFMATGRTPLQDQDVMSHSDENPSRELPLEGIDDPTLLDLLVHLSDIKSVTNNVNDTDAKHFGTNATSQEINWIKKHPFFTGVDFENSQNILPPKEPQTLQSLCTQYLRMNSRTFWPDSFKWEAHLPMDLLQPIFFDDITNLIEHRNGWFLKPGEVVVKSGYINHTSAIFRWKSKAKLVLTNHPRLVVVDIEKNKKIDEISWNCSAIEGGVPVVMLEVASDGEDQFKVCQLDGKKPQQRRYNIIEGNVEDWIEAIHQSPIHMHPSRRSTNTL